MWDRLTPAELDWKRSCAAFAAAHMAPHVSRYDRENAFPADVHAAAYDAGLMNVGFAPALGGRGASHRTLVVGAEELAATCAPMAFTMAFNHGSLQPVLQAGTPGQQQRFVRDLLARRGYASICLTEAASAGTSLTAIRTRATREPGGWRLWGSKVMIGNGTVSELFLVLADTFDGDRARGLSFFAVPRGPGVDVGLNPEKIGFRCLPTPTIRFEGVFVPDEDVIGEIGGGPAILAHALDYMRFGGAAVILGIVVGALRDIAPWLEERIVFPGEPLIEKSHVGLDLGDLFLQVQSVRQLAWAAAERLDRGEPATRETTMGKLAASRLALAATDRIAALYGWRGVVDDYPIQKRVRDARVTPAFEGTNELQLLNLARDARASLASDGWL